MIASDQRRRAALYFRGALAPTTSDELASRWLGFADELLEEANRLETAHLEEGECLEDGRTKT